MNNAVQTHYDAFLTGRYTWISGRGKEQIQKNRKFFSSHALTPRDKHVVINLGAGC